MITEQRNHSVGSQRSQSPQFDDSCQDEEEFGENDSVFGRLEHSREALERRIGHEVLIQAYNIIQVRYAWFCALTSWGSRITRYSNHIFQKVQDSEDENISFENEVQNKVGVLLGEAQHLFPAILHLVLADSAFCTGNAS